jgi:anti-anti-sigma regulatory factor
MISTGPDGNAVTHDVIHFSRRGSPPSDYLTPLVGGPLTRLSTYIVIRYISAVILMTGTSPFTLVLSDDLSVKSAQVLLDQLRDAVANHSTVALDMTAVSQADVTTIQTILSARAKALSLGKSLTLSAAPGPKVMSVLEAGGFLNPAQPEARFWTQFH